MEHKNTGDLLAEDDDPLDIRLDNVFKAVFTRDSPESKGALSRMVSGITGWTLSVIRLDANEPPVGDTADRQLRFDINCRAETGELVNVEMSFNPGAFEPVRLEYHAAKLFTAQGIRGAKKSYGDLKEAYQISFLARRFFGDGDFLHRFEYYDGERRMPLGGRSRIITLELGKADAEKAAEEMGAPELWAVFFRYLTDGKRRKINEIARYEEGIAMAGAAVMGISRDEAERFRLLGEHKRELDLQSGFVEAERAGERKGALEIARKLKKRNIPAEQIAEDTGLSIDEIAGL